MLRVQGWTELIVVGSMSLSRHFERRDGMIRKFPKKINKLGPEEVWQLSKINLCRWKKLRGINHGQKTLIVSYKFHRYIINEARGLVVYARLKGVRNGIRAWESLNWSTYFLNCIFHRQWYASQEFTLPETRNREKKNNLWNFSFDF